MSNRPSAVTVSSSRMDPRVTVHSPSTPKRSRSSTVAATDSASKSKERTRAPMRFAARENRPLPQPTSRNVRPVRSVVPSGPLSESIAAWTRPSSTSSTNARQLLPKANLSPARISCWSSIMVGLPVRNGVVERWSSRGGQTAQREPERRAEHEVGQRVGEEETGGVGGGHRPRDRQVGGGGTAQAEPQQAEERDERGDPRLGRQPQVVVVRGDVQAELRARVGGERAVADAADRVARRDPYREPRDLLAHRRVVVEFGGLPVTHGDVLGRVEGGREEHAQGDGGGD